MLKPEIYEILISAVENAAISSYKWVGKKNNKAADQAAVSAMRAWLLEHQFPGKVVIGEGERDLAPMLFIGETFSSGNLLYDIAVDPLEGTNLCAYNQEGAMSVMAVGKAGSLLHAPDLYMKKIAAGSHIPRELLDLNLSLTEILSNIAKFSKKKLSDVTLTILNRERHRVYIEEAKALGVRINLIEDGDILAVINCSNYYQNCDLYYGSGGAPEGVLAAAALKCLGGQFYGQLIFNEAQAAIKKNFIENKMYAIEDLVQDDVIFVAAGITDSNLLKAITCENHLFNCNILLCHHSRKLIRNIFSKQLL